MNHDNSLAPDNGHAQEIEALARTHNQLLLSLSHLLAAGRPVRITLRLNITAGSENADGPRPLPPLPPGEKATSPMERAIFAVLGRAERPLKARTIAARAGLNFGSYLRGVLAEMARNGRLKKVNEGEECGYVLGGPPPRKPPSAAQNGDLSNDDLAERVRAARANKVATNGRTVGDLDGEGR